MTARSLEQPAAITEKNNEHFGLDDLGLRLAYAKQDVGPPLQLHPQNQDAQAKHQPAHTAADHSAAKHQPAKAEHHAPAKGDAHSENKKPVTLRDQHFTSTVEGQHREFELHLPRGYNSASSKLLPVIYVLPGVSEKIEDMKSSTNLNAMADSKGFAVVYLQAESKILGNTAWNLEHGALSPKSAEYDDVNYVKAVKERVEQKAHFDTHREYIVGHSEGGAAAQFIAHSMPGVFAGIGGVKSTRLTDDPLPRKDDPTAAVFVMGQNDPVLPIGGGTILFPVGVAAPFIFNSRPQEQVNVFAKANECNGGTTKDTTLERTINYKCDLAPVTQIFQYGSNHSWNDHGNTTKLVVDNLMKFQKPDDAETAALPQITKSLAGDIFNFANIAKAGDKLAAHGKVQVSADEYLDATANIAVEKKGLPEPIRLGSDTTTVVPSMSEGAFADLVVSPILQKELAGAEAGKPFNFKLALPDGEEMSGRVKFSITRHRGSTL